MDILKLKDFAVTHAAIIKRIEEICKIMGWKIGEDFDGLDEIYFNEERGTSGITYQSSSYVPMSDPDKYYHTFTFEELCEPDEYWHNLKLKQQHRTAPDVK